MSCTLCVLVTKQTRNKSKGSIARMFIYVVLYKTYRYQFVKSLSAAEIEYWSTTVWEMCVRWHHEVFTTQIVAQTCLQDEGWGRTESTWKRRNHIPLLFIHLYHQTDSWYFRDENCWQYPGNLQVWTHLSLNWEYFSVLHMQEQKQHMSFASSGNRFLLYSAAVSYNKCVHVCQC